MDATDQRILQLLQENAKWTSKELASRVGLSITPTYERIRKLEQLGIIKGYVALLDADKVGLPLMAYCHVSLKEHVRDLLEAFRDSIMQFPEIVECHHVAGNYDFLLKVMVKDMHHYQDFIVNKLASSVMISQVHTSFVINTLKQTTALPVDLE